MRLQSIILAVLATLVSACANQHSVLNAADEADALQGTKAASTGTVPRDVTVFLTHEQGSWKASLDGNLSNPKVEAVRFRKGVSWSETPVIAFERERDRAYPAANCIEKWDARGGDKGGHYQPCNSAFYTPEAARTAVFNLGRALFSLGTGPVIDSVNGTFSVVRTLDRGLLEAALRESGAVELARANLPLLEYEARFHAADTAEELQRFIAEYDEKFDPTGRVAQARTRLANVQERSARERRYAEEQQRRRAAQQQRVAERIKVGDEVSVVGLIYRPVRALVLEVRRPLVHVQWAEGFLVMDQTTRWVRLEDIEEIITD